ncbi:hypothetical protein NQZ68_027805 [Dissostichus eleginoides]|nr:hypothetical protein NQZ68_027805 [Dissostichus eleginoides]
MRLRGLSWNVHRGQLLCITRSSRPRKPWARCPPASPLSVEESIPPGCPRREGSGAGCQAPDVGRDRGGAPLLHLGYCLQSLNAQRNVRNNTNINTASHIPHLELMVEVEVEKERGM